MTCARNLNGIVTLNVETLSDVVFKISDNFFKFKEKSLQLYMHAYKYAWNIAISMTSPKQVFCQMGLTLYSF